MTAESSLAAFFAELAHRGSMPVGRWPADEDLALYGLEQRDQSIFPAAPYDPLSAEAIRAALSQRATAWLRELDVLTAVGSTNDVLASRAAGAIVDGCVCLAELQLAGRGRRGRTWFSPFAVNLALSLGISVSRPAAELGGVSLVVGLAVVEALESLGVDGVGLKWPNDVLLHDAKLGGILIELVEFHGTVQLVIGVGLNCRLPAGIREQLDQQVTDLASLGPPPPRSLLAARMISTMVEFVSEFAALGFAPFQEAFNSRHRFHGRDAQILVGDDAVVGVVVGVSASGGLLLRTDEGVREYFGGEVSLRPAT